MTELSTFNSIAHSREPDSIRREAVRRLSDEELRLGSAQKFRTTRGGERRAIGWCDDELALRGEDAWTLGKAIRISSSRRWEISLVLFGVAVSAIVGWAFK